MFFLNKSLQPYLLRGENVGKQLEGTVVTVTAEQVFLPLTVGGGVRSVEDVRKLLLAGADKAGINTAAVADPELVRRASDAFGSQAIVVAVDARHRPDRPGNWEVFTHGGRKPTDIDAVAWCARMAELGAGEILLTSMDRDGTRDGFDLELTRAVADQPGDAGDDNWRHALRLGASDSLGQPPGPWHDAGGRAAAGLGADRGLGRRLRR